MGRDEILSRVRKFSEGKLLEERLPFVPGETPVPVSGKVLHPDDFVAIVDSVLDGWLTSGRYTERFQRDLARYVGARSATFVNSGSSANLLALTALTSKSLGSRALRPGDEVVTAAMGFPTTVNPIIQNGLKPVFVDVELGTYNATAEQLREAIGSKTRAIMLAHTLGNPFPAEEVRTLCDENELWLIEDSCDALGSTHSGRFTGSFGDTATVSFYPAHHITTGEGGAVFAQSPRIRRLIESFRDWGRDCYCETGCDNTCLKRFEWQLGDLPEGYDHKYIYSHIGYNLKATDLQAALGVSQLNCLDEFRERRQRNFRYLHQRLSTVAELILPEATPKSDPSWFGFPISVRPESGLRRNALTRFLESRKIGTRLMFAGNILRQPAYSDLDARIVGTLSNSDFILNNSFWVGVYPGLEQAQLDFIADSIVEFVNHE